MKRFIIASVLILAASAPILAQSSPSTMNKDAVVTTTSGASTSYPTVMSTAIFLSKVKGLSVYNQDDKNVGEIEDVAMNTNHVAEAYIVSVGGFLGMGEHYVAISPSAIDVKWDNYSKKWTAKIAASAEQLKAAPQFTYPK